MNGEKELPMVSGFHKFPGRQTTKEAPVVVVRVDVVVVVVDVVVCKHHGTGTDLQFQHEFKNNLLG